MDRDTRIYRRTIQLLIRGGLVTREMAEEAVRQAIILENALEEMQQIKDEMMYKLLEESYTDA